MNEQAKVQGTCDINQLVLVKLNHLGLRHIYELYIADVGVKNAVKLTDYKGPETNSRGYSVWPLWSLMETFGTCMGAGLHAPWDEQIIFVGREYLK